MNLAGVLLRAAEETPEAAALRVGDRTLGYATMRARATRLASRLAELGGAPGDRIAILAANDPGFVVSYLAVLWLGAIAVPLNPGSPVPELTRELAAVEPRLALCSARLAPLLEAAAASTGLGSDARVVVEGDDEALDGWPSLAMAARDDRDVAALLFTSGTAGPPKAAMLTHGNLASNLEQVLAHPGLTLTAADVGLGVLPFFHVFGLNAVLGLTLAAGGCLVLGDASDSRTVASMIRDHGVTVVAGVPAMYAAWLGLDEADVPAETFATVRLAVSGAASLPAEVATGMRDRFGLAVHEGYGLTEAAPIVATSVGHRLRSGSIGPPLHGVEVRLVDEDGQDVPAGDPGEIWVRGPNVFHGYWRDAAATDRVLDRDGWLRTGDVAVADDDGYLRLVDRAKDLVIVSGFNVFPAEVEDVLREHPDVADAAVVGVADARTGEAVKAYVVAASDRAPQPEQLRAFTRDRLARYKCPQVVELVVELPRTVAGKVLRRELR